MSEHDNTGATQAQPDAGENANSTADPHSLGPTAASPSPDDLHRNLLRTRALSWLVVGLVLIVSLLYLARERRNARLAGTASAAMPVIYAEHPEGMQAPDFTLPTPDGKQVHFADFKGKPVIIDFWATWCGPCKIEIPLWQQFQDKYRAQGLTIIGISEDNDDSAVVEFLKAHALNYVVANDDGKLHDTYGDPYGLPTTLFIRRDGTIADKLMGLDTPAELEKRVKEILQ